MNAIDKNIRKLRKERKLSQKQLAERLHVTRQAVSSWETGKNQPDIEMLEAIARAFDTDLYMILYGRKINEESGESVSKRKKYHLYTALICGAVVLAGVISWIILKDKVMELRRLYYNMVPYFIFYLLVRPVTFFAGGAGLMHLLGLLADFSVRRAWIRRIILFFSAALVYHMEAIK